MNINRNRNKIVFASGIFPPDIGGPATYTERMAGEFSAQNFRVAVIAYGDKQIKREGYNFPVVIVSRKYPKAVRYLLYFFNTLRLSKDSDVIYSQNLTSAGLPALIAAKIFNKKFVVKIVGDASWERARENRLTKDNILAFQSGTYDFRTYILRKIQKFVAEHANRIIVPSEYLKKIVVGWGINHKKVYVVYNAAGGRVVANNSLTKESAQEKIGIKGDIILSIGRIMPWKGFGELIDIVPSLLQYNSKFHLVIVGEGPLLEDLRFKIKDMGLDDKVKLVGGVEHREIFAYFKAADMFVLNSSYEGLSHVILEAMESGVPVLATNVGGNSEVIVDKVNGFLVDHDNTEELQEKIFMLWKDKELQNTFIKNSYEKLKQFSFSKMREDTIKVLCA